MEQPQQELTERPAVASAEAAEHKVQLEAAERWDSVNYRDSQTNSQPLRQTTARQKRRGRAILVAGLAVPLVALLLWGAQTLIQLAAAQREMARLSAAVEASDSVIAKLHDEAVIVRQAVESARQTTPAETSAGTGKQLDAALASAIDAEKSTARAQAETMHLRGENTRLTDELTRTKGIVDILREVRQQAEAEVVRLREELAARQQEAAATQAPTGLGATAPSDHIPVADQKDPDQTQDAEDVEAAPEIEEILTAAEFSSDPVTSETNAPRYIVSPDDLLLEPGHHVGREVVVTGSVVWLLRRYWLQSDSGHMSMLIDVKGLQSDDRNKLKDAVVQIEFLAQVRARITGRIERQGSENHRLAATELVLVE